MRQISTCHAPLIAVVAGAVIGSVATAAGQPDERPFSGSPDHPSIEYARQAFTDPVAELNRKLLVDAARLTFDERSGYLRSVLKELNFSVESQLMVFSK